jgi:hypothetical protein
VGPPAGGPPPPYAGAERRGGGRRTLNPVLVAAAAAGLIAVIGVVTGTVLREASDFEPMADEVALDAEVAEDAPVPEVAVFATDNDFGDLELRRLAVNVDTQHIIHPETRTEDAAPLADHLVGQLLRLEVAPAAEAEQLDAPEADVAEEPADDVDADEPVGARVVTAPPEEVSRCLPEIVDDARAPMVPAYVELARFAGEPAIVYLFHTEEPTSGEYRRVEVWAVARDDCQVLGFAQYDR